MPITRFPTRADTVTDRMTGFIAHLRTNGMNVGVAETQCAMEALTAINPTDMNETRLAIKSICANDADHFAKFDGLFKAYWQNQGRVRSREAESRDTNVDKNRWSNQSIFDQGKQAGSSGTQDTPDDDKDGEASQDGDGKLIASKTSNIQKADLREFMKPGFSPRMPSR